MGNNSIDDEWDDLLGDEAPAPATPKTVKARQTDSVVAVDRATPVATPKARVEIPAPKRRPSPKQAGAPKRGPVIDATRPLVVPPPPTVGQPNKNDALPNVPTWGGADDKDPISIEPVTVPEPSDIIDVDDLGARDQSANIRLDALHPNLPAEESTEPAPEDSLAAIGIDPVAVSGAERAAGGIPEPVLEPTDDPVVPPPFQSATDLAGVAKVSPPPPVEVTKPAVPRPIEETTPAPGKDPEVEDEPERVPDFGGLNAAVAMDKNPKTEAEAPRQGSSAMTWLMASAAVLVVGAVAWMAMGRGAEPQPPSVAAASTQAAPKAADRKPPADAPVEAPAEVAKANPVATPPAVAPSTGATPGADDDSPAAAETGAATGGNAAPAVAAVVDEGEAPDADTEGGAADDAEDEGAHEATPPTTSTIPPVDPEAATRYEEGAARYARDQSQEALEIMAKAACAMDDGVKARAAFRKLTGGDVRKSVMIRCRKNAIDLNAKGDEPTPAELLRRAERALDAGDHKTALALARKSNRLERSQAAVYVTALAACAAGDKEKAASMRRHLNRARKAELAERCPGMPESG